MVIGISEFWYKNPVVKYGSHRLPPVGGGAVGGKVGLVGPVPPPTLRVAAALPLTRLLVMAHSHSSVQTGGLVMVQCALQFVGLPPPGHAVAAKAGDDSSAKITHAAVMTKMPEKRIVTSL